MAGQSHSVCPVSPTGRRFNRSSLRQRGNSQHPTRRCVVSLRVLSARGSRRLASLREKTSEPASQDIELISSLPSVIFYEMPCSTRLDSHATWSGCRRLRSWSSLIHCFEGLIRATASVRKRSSAPDRAGGSSPSIAQPGRARFGLGLVVLVSNRPWPGRTNRCCHHRPGAQWTA